MISYTLVLIMLCLWARRHGTSGQYCFDQPARAELLEGQSFTVMCQFVYPESAGSPDNVDFMVKAADRRYCGRDDEFIYKSNNGALSSKYQGRLNVTFDLSHRNASITVHNVTMDDAISYCCRLEVTFANGGNMKWQTIGGTRLMVRDRNDPSLETIPVVFAAPGDNVTLIGHLGNIGTSLSKITCYTGWIVGGKCDHSKRFTDCTYKNNILSSQINQVSSSVNGFYCWKVEISTKNEKKMKYYKGTQLHVIKKTNTLNIVQPEELEFHPHATISCSFNVQQENILRTEVYWVIGDARENYVYHPNLNYVHPEYRGKTRLVNGSNLHLEDFPGPNNTIFYCRVIIRQCNSKHTINTFLEEGPGTRLYTIVPDIGATPNNNLPWIEIVVVCLVLVFLLSFITLAIYFLKKRRGNKQKSSGETIVETMKMEDKDKEAYENLPRIPRQNKGEDVVYAAVNHSSSAVHAKAEELPDAESQDIYAEVKKGSGLRGL